MEHSSGLHALSGGAYCGVGAQAAAPPALCGPQPQPHSTGLGEDWSRGREQQITANIGLSQLQHGMHRKWKEKTPQWLAFQELYHQVTQAIYYKTSRQRQHIESVSPYVIMLGFFHFHSIISYTYTLEQQSLTHALKQQYYITLSLSVCVFFY